MMRKSVWTAALVLIVGLASIGMSQEDVLGRVKAASAGLEAFRATIYMVNYGSRKAEIEFAFAFVPPSKMRIEYLAPKNLEGQLVILNGDQLYIYLPALHRAVRKTVSEGSEHPGTEMGFLYYFVEKDLAAFLEGLPLTRVAGLKGFVWRHGEEVVTCRAYELTFTGEKEKQIVWCDAETFVPVAVDIYQGGKLAIQVRVVEYEYNGVIPPEEFAIPG
mgnify:CR=1 FL=1|jgi:outer membrane lipoprotein-sorting protein